VVGARVGHSRVDCPVTRVHGLYITFILLPSEGNAINNINIFQRPDSTVRLVVWLDELDHLRANRSGPHSGTLNIKYNIKRIITRVTRDARRHISYAELNEIENTKQSSFHRTIHQAPTSESLGPDWLVQILLTSHVRVRFSGCFNTV
jgi:hypothetical protein